MNQLQAWPTPDIFYGGNSTPPFSPWGPEGQPPASQIIYYVLDNSGPSPLAVDISTVPGGKNATDFAGGVFQIVPGLITSAWQGGSYSASGDCWSRYAPGGTTGIGNKFTFRLWFKLDEQVFPTGSSSGMILPTLNDSFSLAIRPDEPSGRETFSVRATFGPINLDSALTAADFTTWHRAVVTANPDTGLILLQLDQQTPAYFLGATVNPATATGRIQIRCPAAGVFDPFPDQPSPYHVCEMYTASNYVWTAADSVSDWNAGAGRTWPAVPGL